MSDYGERKCLVCGKPFEAEFAQSVCCSAECQKKRGAELKKRWSAEKRPRIHVRLDAIEARIAALECRVPTKLVMDALVDSLGTAKPAQEDIAQEYGKALEEESQDDSPALDNETEVELAEEAEEAQVGKMIANLPKMQHCDRMRLDATELPCGKRAECFEPKQCKRCPADAPPISSNTDFNPYVDFRRGRPKKGVYVPPAPEEPSFSDYD